MRGNLCLHHGELQRMLYMQQGLLQSKSGVLLHMSAAAQAHWLATSHTAHVVLGRHCITKQLKASRVQIVKHAAPPFAPCLSSSLAGSHTAHVELSSTTQRQLLTGGQSVCLHCSVAHHSDHMIQHCDEVRVGMVLHVKWLQLRC